ncbi:MAG: cell division protein FtsW [Frankiales bacterium]|nr:cell division protein FtsW [Frankiales bacterium]
MTTVPGVATRRAAAPARSSVLQRPLASYYLVLVSTGLLLAIGFVMVLSASSVRSYQAYGSAYAIASKQGVFIVIGLPALWVASRLPVQVWRRLGLPLLLVALFLLCAVLVPGIGRNVDGARRWIPLPGGFNIQPSELAKLGIALWGADLLVRKRKLLRDWKHLLIPLVPIVGLVCVLVMLEPDMGTTIVVTSVLMSLLWVVGAPARVFVGLVSVALSLGAVMAIAEPYRLARLTSFSNPCSITHRLDKGYQACQGLQALDAGGWFGLGLGASREKWAGGLPNPYTDYVYAIIGEELGLLGTLTVLLLFATLTYAGIRIAKRTTDPFARLAATGFTIWIAVQALVNMGTVVGMVPITGIPLPLISFGGSALIPTLVGVGMLLSFAAAEPGAAKALAAKQGRLRQLVLRRSPVAVTVPRQREQSASRPSRRPVARRR